ncbi:unnamed protein product [Absidia cylindrospora]
MIFDLDDNHCPGMFTTAELDPMSKQDHHNKQILLNSERDELDTMGNPLIRQIPDYVQHHLDQLRHLKSAREAMTMQERSTTTQALIINTSTLFLHRDNNIKEYPESDQLYRLWDLVYTISVINALSKEVSSVANAIAINRKRRHITFNTILNG